MTTKVDYSPTEVRLLELVRTKRSISSDKLTDLFYSDGRPRPWHAAIVVNAGMRALIAKASHNREEFTIKRARPAAREPIVYSYEKRRA